MADEVITKLETLQESIHNIEKLQIQTHLEIKTISERGCIKGEQMNVQLEEKVMTELRFINKMFKGGGIIAGILTGIGGLMMALKK